MSVPRDTPRIAGARAAIALTACIGAHIASAQAPVEPPAAADNKQVATPAQEAAEILASGRFLAPLIPEGGHLVRAKGSLGRDEFLGVWTLEMVDRINGAANRSLILLPSEALADMVRLHLKTTADSTSAPLFEVSGAILVFKRTNYLLPSMATPIDRRIGPAAPALFVAPGSEASKASAAAQVAAQQGTAQAPTPEQGPVDPEDFARSIEERLNQRITAVPSSADAAAPAAPAPPGTQQPSQAVAPATDQGAPTMPLIDASTSQPSAAATGETLLGATRLQSRRGTVTRDPISGTYRFILASGHADEGDVALELLPCEALNQLIATERSNKVSSAVLLTGDVTVFNGRNYLRPTRIAPLKAGKWLGP